MSDVVIRVENLSKEYRLGTIGGGTIREDLDRWWAKRRGKGGSLQKIGEADHGNRSGEQIFALHGIDFEVRRGEILGIIGRNGAGKSTLLKILSRVTTPTSGKVKIKGRIASLLEVGTGFHPELTGRENIYLNGAILGMRQYEIDHKYDEIVDFSGVEQFIDTPVKRYSSGMKVRLAFAVAAHLEPEILLIDEVLAVGDAEFQKKCLGKMGDVAGDGRTVLFVSHNMVAMQTLCQRALWLESGCLKTDGSVSEIVSLYLQTSLTRSDVPERIWPELEDAPGNDTVRLHRIAIKTENEQSDGAITMETGICIELDYWNLLPSAHLHATLHIYNEQEIIAFTTSAASDLDPFLHVDPPTGMFHSVCHIPANLLNSGHHRIDLFFVRDTGANTSKLSNVIGFDVVDNRKRNFHWFGKEPGAVAPKLVWETQWVKTD